MAIKYLILSESERWSSTLNEAIFKARNKYDHKFCLLMSSGISLINLADFVDYYKIKALRLDLFDAIISYKLNDPSWFNGTPTIRQKVLDYQVLKNDRGVVSDVEDHYEVYRRNLPSVMNLFTAICEQNAPVLKYSKNQKKKRIIL